MRPPQPGSDRHTTHDRVPIEPCFRQCRYASDEPRHSGATEDDGVSARRHPVGSNHPLVAPGHTGEHAGGSFIFPTEAAAFRALFAQGAGEAMATQWDHVRTTFASRFEKAARLVDVAKEELLAFGTFSRSVDQPDIPQAAHHRRDRRRG